MNTETTLRDLIGVTRQVPKDSAEHQAALTRIAAILNEDPTARAVLERLIAEKPPERSVSPPEPRSPDPKPSHTPKAPQSAEKQSKRPVPERREEKAWRKPTVSGSMGTADARPSFPPANIWEIWMKNDP